jgi:hypothetical protein
MKKMVLFLLILFFGVIGLVLYSCVVVGKRADNAEIEYEPTDEEIMNYYLNGDI